MPPTASKSFSELLQEAQTTANTVDVKSASDDAALEKALNWSSSPTRVRVNRNSTIETKEQMRLGRSVFAKSRPASTLFHDVRAKTEEQVEKTPESDPKVMVGVDDNLPEKTQEKVEKTPEKAEEELSQNVDTAEKPERKEETASTSKEEDKINEKISEGENMTPVEEHQPKEENNSLTTSPPQPNATQDGEQKSTEKKKSLRELFYDLSSNDASVVELASKELIEMKLWSDSQKKKTVQSIQKGTAAPAALTLEITKAFRNHQSNPVITCNCLGLLLGLTSLEIKEFNKAVSELEGCKYAVQSMKNFPKHAQIQSHGLGLICNICTWSKKDAAKIVEWEGIDVVIASMNEYPDLADTQRRGCKVLADLGKGNKDWKKEIRDKKGIMAIAYCLQTFDKSTAREAGRAMSVHI